MRYVYKQLSFHRLVLCWIGLVYLWGLRWIVDPKEQPLTADQIVIFTILMALHLAMYWISYSQTTLKSWSFLYFVMQGILVVTISLLLRHNWSATVTVGLYLALISEAVSILQRSRQLLIVTVSYLILFCSNILLVFWSTDIWLNWEPLRISIFLIIPSVLFLIGYMILFVQQMRARERAQKLLHELEFVHAELERYAERVEDLTLINERQRIARELHDTLAQGLVGLILQLEAVDTHLIHDRKERAREIVQQAMSRARATLANVRLAIDDLRLSEEDHSMTLQKALQEEIQSFINFTGIACKYDLTALPEHITPQSEHILRTMTESLTNIARHAKAKHVWILASREHGKLMIEIRDDGVGFDLNSMIARTGHHGLVGLCERAQLVQGKLDIVSKIGQGTTIRLCLSEMRAESLE